MFHPCVSLCVTDPRGSPSAIRAQTPVLATSYLHLAKCLLQRDDLVVLVGAGDTAHHADADRVRLAVALQQFAVLAASSLCQNLGVTGLYQDMVFQVGLCSVLAQVGLAQGSLAGQAGLHGCLGLPEARITKNHPIFWARTFVLIFTFHFTVFLLLLRGSIQELLHDAAELDVGLQLRGGVCLGVAQRAAERALRAKLAGLLDALLAEAVAAAQGHGGAVNVQADGTGQLLRQPGQSGRAGHGARGRAANGAAPRGTETESQGAAPRAGAAASSPCQGRSALPSARPGRTDPRRQRQFGCEGRTAQPG